MQIQNFLPPHTLISHMLKNTIFKFWILNLNVEALSFHTTKIFIYSVSKNECESLEESPNVQYLLHPPDYII